MGLGWMHEAIPATPRNAVIALLILFTGILFALACMQMSVNADQLDQMYAPTATPTQGQWRTDTP